jgi:hypothetical protein
MDNRKEIQQAEFWFNLKKFPQQRFVIRLILREVIAGASQGKF